jgi:hypothetical protein
MQGGAAATDAGTETHDGIAMSLGKALRRADAATFNQGADDGGLTFDRKNVHGGPNPLLWLDLGDSLNRKRKPLYWRERSSRRGPIPMKVVVPEPGPLARFRLH